MATDICSEISSFSFSPRISFSHDLNQTDQQDHRYKDQQYLDHKSISDTFNFCVIKNDNNFSFEFSSADELFSNGRILPIQIKNTNHHRKPNLLHKNDNIVTKKVQLREFLSSSYESDEDKEEENDNSKAKSSPNETSFWKFRRSSSLNFEKIKSLHFISRSNSTGSTQPNKKPSLKKHKSLDSNSSSSSSSSSSRGNNNNNNHGYKRSSSFSSHYSNNNNNNNNNNDVNLWSKSFPRKNNNCNGGSQFYGNYGNNNNGVRVSPVLNLPQPYISKETIISFFGFGSLFCNGKVRKKK